MLSVNHRLPQKQTKLMVFVYLCYTASPLGPAESFCVDLATGKTSVLPGNTVDVMWTNKPTSDGGRCNLRGMLKITPPKWAQSVSYHMAFEHSTLFSFNIGDSLTNNGWGKNNDSWENVLRQCQVPTPVHDVSKDGDLWHCYYY